ncbi:hypothetical protein [Sphaerisporangium fuscum]|uniref:hypothetical protein n=1 Tax=Sphaerisporangium fuscum TaxID=2835868 RepID=UPI001BDC0C1E|nr:hypothetical protein [Sphaerisporangium fuscum]
MSEQTPQGEGNSGGSGRSSLVLTVAGLVVAVVSALAALIVVPEIRTMLGLSNDPPSSAPAAPPSQAQHSAPLPVGSGTDGTPPATPSPSPSRASGDEIRWSGPLILTYVDLDTVPPTVLSSNDRASVWVNYGSDKNEVYGLRGALFTTNPTVALWETAAKPTREQCTEMISTQGTETLRITSGTRFCARTAGGRTAFVTVKSFDDSREAYKATATVWDAVSPENQ